MELQRVRAKKPAAGPSTEIAVSAAGQTQICSRSVEAENGRARSVEQNFAGVNAAILNNKRSDAVINQYA